MSWFLFHMAMKNAWRHRLRALLTLSGVLLAIVAFGLLRTLVEAWYSGVDAASDNRLIVRNKTSLTFPLPRTYAEPIRQVSGVRAVSIASWFSGIYIEPANFFPQFAVEADSYFRMYPEFLVPPEQMSAFLSDRRGAVVGRKLADRFGWKVGDVVPLKGTIFPGDWAFVVRAIYDGKDARIDTGQFFFHWSYLNETMRSRFPDRSEKVGVYVVQLTEGDRSAEVSLAIDRQFANSYAETLTETEKAFQLSFVKMTSAIVDIIQVVSLVVIVIIMAVMSNTMAMAARERTAEYATLKALGFPPRTISVLIYLEAVVLCGVGGALGIALTWPVVEGVGNLLSKFMPVFQLQGHTVLLQGVAIGLIALVAAAVPAHVARRQGIVEGLRAVA